jgi:hypothetical protein
MPSLSASKRAKAAIERGYPSTAVIRSVSLATDATMARRREARLAIRRILVDQYGPDAVERWPDGDDLGA